MKLNRVLTGKIINIKLKSNSWKLDVRGSDSVTCSMSKSFPVRFLCKIMQYCRIVCVQNVYVEGLVICLLYF